MPHHLTITGRDAILVLESLRDQNMLDPSMLTWTVQKQCSSQPGSCRLQLQFSGGDQNWLRIICIDPITRKSISRLSMIPSSVVLELQFLRLGGMVATRRYSRAQPTRRPAKLLSGRQRLFLTLAALISMFSVIAYVWSL